MKITRREFAVQTGAAAACGLWAVQAASAQTRDRRFPLIIDTHQHLWDLEKFKLAWLDGAPEVLRQSYRTQEYRQATEGLNVQAIYMEVDVDPAQHVAEAEHVVNLCRSDEHPTVAAVVGGRPASPDFADYVRRLKQFPEVKGVRQVLHGATPQGYCLQDDFVRGIKLLGENGLSFDLCLRPRELSDGAKLAEQLPEVRFIVDHCGNADPKAFSASPGDEKPWHDADAWRRDMESLARQKNTICKISGIVARAPQGWTAEGLAPIVNHCLDTFGPDRVVFGGDWPVCLLGAPLRQWIDALGEIIAERPAAQQNQLWHENAQRLYLNA
jgi:L-fuconolactonase